MKLHVYRNLWGVPGPRAESIARIEALGYHGIEAVIFSPAESSELANILPRHRLAFKGVIWTRGQSVEEITSSFDAQLQTLIDLGASTISVIGGYDCWNDDERARYFEYTLAAEQKRGLSIAHETHRNSALFHPLVTLPILKRFPELKLVCDLSHWVLCAERLIDDQLEAIRACGRQAVHLHARVGTEQAPQLVDLRAPESAPYLHAFERWWEIIWTEQHARGLPISSLCPELGPRPYQLHNPGAADPVSDLWLQCEWQRARQVRRFDAWHARRDQARGGP